ncbi:peptidoglycan-binding protein, partial [Candidatus Giovannonibacteria bacterium]|nr:peptidoglycan-binding protein [Candidatus Giovannonibacteria bacterium]
MSIKFKKAISTKIAVTFLSFSTAMFVSGASIAMPLVANAALTEAQISSILSLLDSFGVDAATRTNVNASLRGLPTTPTTPSAGACTFTKDLTVGSTGDDVKCLQKYLNGAGHQVAASGAGSPGNETTYFGSLTQAAVSKWQAANGVSPSAGYFGSKSRAKYTAVAGTGTGTGTGTDGGTTTPPPTGTGLRIDTGTHPANSLAPQGAARVPFTVIKLTAGTDGDVSVTGVTVERTGLAADAAFADLVLLDENGVQMGLAKTLNSDHRAVVGEAFTVKSGQTRTVTVAGNMGADTTNQAGQVAYLSVVSVNTAATVTGSLPIAGAGHTINASLTIGTVGIAKGPLDPGAAQSKKVGDAD